MIAGYSADLHRDICAFITWVQGRSDAEALGLEHLLGLRNTLVVRHEKYTPPEPSEPTAESSVPPATSSSAPPVSSKRRSRMCTPEKVRGCSEGSVPSTSSLTLGHAPRTPETPTTPPGLSPAKHFDHKAACGLSKHVFPNTWTFCLSYGSQAHHDQLRPRTNGEWTRFPNAPQVHPGSRRISKLTQTSCAAAGTARLGAQGAVERRRRLMAIFIAAVFASAGTVSDSEKVGERISLSVSVMWLVAKWELGQTSVKDPPIVRQAGPGRRYMLRSGFIFVEPPMLGGFRSLCPSSSGGATSRYVFHSGEPRRTMGGSCNETGGEGEQDRTVFLQIRSNSLKFSF